MLLIVCRSEQNIIYAYFGHTLEMSLTKSKEIVGQDNVLTFSSPQSLSLLDLKNGELSE